MRKVPTNIESLEQLEGAKILFVASTGGHLAQLDLLSQRIRADPDSVWVSFDKPQSRSMFENRRHHYVNYVAPRDYAGLRRAWPDIWTLMKTEKFDVAISTGAAISLAALPIARLQRVPALYIESVSRFDGPSLSGRVLRRIPQINLRTQHARWADKHWTFERSVMDRWVPESRPHKNEPLKIFVTLGTIKPYRFDRLVNQLTSIAPEGTEFRWQLGCTVRDDLPGKTTNEMSAAEFSDAVTWADLVVTHSGVGTILQLLEVGQPTLVVPRRRLHDEHVDDHQMQIARELSNRSLFHVVEADQLTASDLFAAQAKSARSETYA